LQGKKTFVFDVLLFGTKPEENVMFDSACLLDNLYSIKYSMISVNLHVVCYAV